MKEIKDRWQFIIGFAAIIISLSAFKDELKGIIIDYNYISFSLSQYLFVITVSFLVVIHLYVIPYIFSNTSYSSNKIFLFIEKLSYFLFIFIILTPTLLLLIYIVQLVVLQILSLDATKQSIISGIISFIAGILTVVLTKSLSKRYRNNIKEQEEITIREKEVQSLETAKKLIESGYYSQSIFEIFKILDYNVYQTLRDKNLVFRKSNFLEMISIAEKYGVYTKDEIQKINQIRIKRNEIAHNLGTNVTQQEAKNALEFVFEIILKNQQQEEEQEERDETVEAVETNEKSNIKRDSKYFKGKVYESLEEAQKIAELKNKPIFLVVYDKDHPRLSKLDYSLKYFMDYDTTKNLVQENFIQVLSDSKRENVDSLIPSDEPLENCLLTILTPNLEIIKQEGVYANSDEGLKRVRGFIENWNSARS